MNSQVNGTSRGESAAASNESPALDVSGHTHEVEAPKRASIRDVARVAGVTYQTVSRVINASPAVRPETRERVLAAITQLDYRPHGAARTLAGGRSKLLGVLSIGTSAYETPSTLEGIETAAAESGYGITFAGTRVADREAIRRAAHSLVDQAVEGVVLISPLVTVALDDLPLPRETPIVAVEGAQSSARVATVVLDQAAGARGATEHLLALGHRTVWHVAGPKDWYDSQERERGWRLALEAAGAETPPVLLGDWGHTAGYEAGRIVSRLPEATAVFAANDSMAMGLLRALHEAGLSVPGDVSVVGFDDLPEAAYMTPPLTTVRQEFFAIGKQSIHTLLDRVAGSDAPTAAQVVPTSLVVRESTAPPPTDRRRGRDVR